MTALDYAIWFTACFIAVCVIIIVVDGLIRLFNRWLIRRERQARRLRYRDLTAHRITPRIPFDWKDRP